MFLCIDIGGTSIKYGILEPCKEAVNFIEKSEFPTNAKRIKGPGIERKIVELAGQMVSRYALSGIAISTAGMVDAVTGQIMYANDNIPEYTGTNLKAVLEKKFNLPCAVENDVNAAALGEFAYGSGRGRSSLLCITVGTGIGGAVILANQLYRGHSGGAGEIGYMIVNGEAFEKNGSASALVARVKERCGEPEIDGREIFARAKRNDRICSEEIIETCDVLAQGIANCLYLLNPEMVILGGGIMAQEEYLRPIVERCLGKYVNPQVLQQTQLSFAKLGNDAGMMGAYYKLKQGLHSV